MSTNIDMKEDPEKVLLRQELLNTQTQRFQLFTVSMTVFIAALSFLLRDGLNTVEGMVLLLLLVPCGIIMISLRFRETKIAGYIATFCDANTRGWSERNDEYMDKYMPRKYKLASSSTQGIMLSYLFMNFVVLVLILINPRKLCTISDILIGIFMVVLTIFNFIWILGMAFGLRKSTSKIKDAWKMLKQNEENAQKTNAKTTENQNSLQKQKGN